jgi:hypothetical protein
MAAESEHDEHTSEATGTSHEEGSEHDSGIPGVDEPLEDPHADAHGASHGQKAKAGQPAGSTKKQLPLKKLVITSSVLLIGVLGLSVVFLLKGKPSASHAEHGEHGETKSAHGADADAHGTPHAAHGEEGADGAHGPQGSKTDGHEVSASAHGPSHAEVRHEEKPHGATHADAPAADHGDVHADVPEDSEAADPHAVSRELEHTGRSYPAFLEPMLGPVETALTRIEDKASVIREALEENRKLRLENANLRVQAESLRLDCRVKDAAAASERNETALLSETGEKVGRTLASIGYRPPRHLDGPQLNTLGLSYLQAGENEKAAVIFTLLSQMSEQAEASVKGHSLGRIRLLAGTAWYRLDHLELADQYFSEVLDMPETEREVKYQAQARMWRAVTAQRLGKATKAQFWMREVLDRHPASDEATWINPKKQGEGHGHH